MSIHSMITSAGTRAAGGEPMVARNFDYLPLIQPFFVARESRPKNGSATRIAHCKRRTLRQALTVVLFLAASSFVSRALLAAPPQWKKSRHLLVKLSEEDVAVLPSWPVPLNKDLEFRACRFETSRDATVIKRFVYTVLALCSFRRSAPRLPAHLGA